MHTKSTMCLIMATVQFPEDWENAIYLGVCESLSLCGIAIEDKTAKADGRYNVAVGYNYVYSL